MIFEALAYYDSQHRIELLPSALLDNESVLKDSAKTETRDGSSQGEVEMDVLTVESDKTNLPQVFLGFRFSNGSFKLNCSIYEYLL